MLCQGDFSGLGVAETATVSVMTDLKDYIKAVRTRNGMTQGQLASLMGYTGKSRRQIVSRVEKGTAGLAPTRLQQLKEKLDLDATEILSLRSPVQVRMPRNNKKAGLTNMYETGGELDSIPLFAYMPPEHSGEAALRVVVGSKARPPLLHAVRNAYAIYMPDETMEPRYRKGWLLWINPAKPAPEDRDAVVFTKSGEVVVRHLVRRSGKLVAEPLVPNSAAVIPAADIVRVHLVVSADQEG